MAIKRIMTTGAPLEPKGTVRVVRHEHQTFVIQSWVPSSGPNAKGARLQGGLPPRVRDNNKAFNSHGPVYGLQMDPRGIGATGGERVILRVKRKLIIK